MISDAIGLGLKTLAVAMGLFGALLMATLVMPDVLPQIRLDEKRTIAVSGSAIISVQPNKVQVSGAVTTSAKSAADALDENNTIMARILEGLKSDGIGRDKISTTGFSIAPQHPPLSRDGYSVNEMVTTGYVVKNSINVTLPANEYSGKLLDRIIRLGATNIDSVSFVVDDARRYVNQARAEAAADARERGQVAAKALGLRLGKVVSIDRIEIPVTEYRMRPRLLAAAAPAPPPTVEIIAREQTFNADLTVVFELE